MYRPDYSSVALSLLLMCSAAHAADIHRVVTTLDANDRSTTLFDQKVELKALGSGNPGAVLWATNSAPAELSFAADGAKKAHGISPPGEGTALRVVDFPPLNAAEEAKLPLDHMMKLVGADAPKRGVPVSNPEMHRTRTVDYAVILSGEIDMLLDDKTVHLKAGDVVVQQATNHAWLNHGTRPCRVLFVLIDSKEP